MTSRYQIYMFSFLLISIAMGIIAYKVNVLGFPLFSEEKRSVWSIEAKVTFKGTKENAFISLALPDEQKGMSIHNESASSPNYGYTKAQRDGYRRGEWAKRKVTGKQTLYYSIDVIMDESHVPLERREYKKNSRIEASNIIVQAADVVMQDAYEHSADDASMTASIIAAFNQQDDSQAIEMLKRKFIHSDKELRDLIAILLEEKKVNIRRVGALELIDGQKNIGLKPMLEVYDDEQWQLFDIHKGKVDKTDRLFIWQRGSVSLLDAEGVKDSAVHFSVTESVLPARNVALLQDESDQVSFLDFSLFILPNEAQNTFKRLLLIPIGALVIVLLRVFIGIKTSGTFMPVLLAMAFMQTELVPGVVMFLVIVSVGLIVRSYFSNLNLLLVARISAVLIIVVGIMALVAILTYKLGIQDAVSITFFPMIILAWTIERMSIIWEEEGAAEVLLQGSGSLFAAIIAYVAMANEVMQFWTYTFPEVLLAVLGLIILIGRYSGYRLNELYRFASMVKRS